MKSGQTLSFQAGVVHTIDFLEKERVDYFILGGLAVGVLGEPRFTYDVDLDIFLAKKNIGPFLTKIKAAHFKINTAEAKKNVASFGTFRIFWQKLQIDFILASTELEQSALKRRKQYPLFGKQLWFPSVEDLILLKLIPGREKDLVDAESLVLRHRDKLDRAYLEQWAQQISDTAENYQIWHRLQRLLTIQK